MKDDLQDNTYMIFVMATTGGARVKNSVRCNIFQIEREKMYICLFLGYYLGIFGCKHLNLKILPV